MTTGCKRGRRKVRDRTTASWEQLMQKYENCFESVWKCSMGGLQDRNQALLRQDCMKGEMTCH
jgi:hypothetical protein